MRVHPSRSYRCSHSASPSGPFATVCALTTMYLPCCMSCSFDGSGRRRTDAARVALRGDERLNVGVEDVPVGRGDDADVPREGEHVDVRLGGAERLEEEGPVG